MTKNIEDLLYRGDSLDKMGEMSGRLREDSRKYKKAAIKINWDAMLAKVSAVFLFTTIHVSSLSARQCFALACCMCSAQPSCWILQSSFAHVFVRPAHLSVWLLRVVDLVISLLAQLPLLLHRDIQACGCAVYIVIKSLQWSSMIDAAALTIRQRLEDISLYGEHIAQNLSLHFNSMVLLEDFY